MFFKSHNSCSIQLHMITILQILAIYVPGGMRQHNKNQQNRKLNDLLGQVKALIFLYNGLLSK